MRVERDRKRVVLVLRDIEHASTEVLGFHCCLSGQQLKNLPDNGILDCLERLHDTARRRDVNFVSEAFRSLLESFLYDVSVDCMKKAK